MKHLKRFQVKKNGSFANSEYSAINRFQPVLTGLMAREEDLNTVIKRVFE